MFTVKYVLVFAPYNANVSSCEWKVSDLHAHGLTGHKFT